LRRSIFDLSLSLSLSPSLNSPVRRSDTASHAFPFPQWRLDAPGGGGGGGGDIVALDRVNRDTSGEVLFVDLTTIDTDDER